MSRGIAAFAFALAAIGLARHASADDSEAPAREPAPAAGVVRSILVLPPLNESADVAATASFLSTITRPLAERGYYVFPVEVIDRLLRENGMPTAGEMHQVPLQKVREVTGADAVLYPVIHQYGAKYVVVATAFSVDVSARLVDARSGALLWEGRGSMFDAGSGGGNPLADAVGRLLLSNLLPNLGPGRDATGSANYAMVTGVRGPLSPKAPPLPFGPRHPQYGR